MLSGEDFDGSDDVVKALNAASKPLTEWSPAEFRTASFSEHELLNRFAQEVRRL